MGDRWLQVNVALRRDDGDALASARAVFAELAPQIASARAEGTLQRFFFMRKPPDMRLRLQGPNPERHLLPAVSGSLAKLRRDGAVERFFPSVYEPEVRLFGGAEAMSLVHDYFDADTAGWMELDRHWAAGVAALQPEDVVSVVANELFALALGDRAEIWDAWSNVLALVAPAAEAADPFHRMMPIPSELRALATPAESRVLGRYCAANEALANGLRDVWSRGRLECGLRGMLPFVVIFHLHRYGLDAARQARVAEAMQRVWDPRGAMHRSDE